MKGSRMSRTHIAPKTLEGWYALHQLFRIDWPELKRLPGEERAGAVREVAGLLQGWREPTEGGWSAAFRIVGGGADLLLAHFRPTLEELSEIEGELYGSRLGDFLEPAYHFLSVVELGMYGLTAQMAARSEGGDGPEVGSEEWWSAVDAAASKQRETEFARHRLAPELPEDMPYVCFYPMSKRRAPGQNWYRLSVEERNDLMRDHGAVGRRYAGKVQQVITGSIGFEEWEWGVTLFAADPLQFKYVVTEMRFDEASARYGEFGPFYVGKRMSREDWERIGSGG